MYYIHLKHYHNTPAPFQHPLLDGCETVSQDVLNAKAQKVIDGGDPEDLIMSLRFCVSMLVGRFLESWPDTLPYEDDMVSQGMLEVSRLCRDIPLDLFAERGILIIANSRAQQGIELMLNEMRSLASASSMQQMRRIRRGEDPAYLQATTNEYTENVHPEDERDEMTREIMDAFVKIVPEDEIDVALMQERNWGRGYQELADEFGVGVGTIHRRKARLYKKYLELTR